MTLVTLRGGLTTRAEAIALGCQLEARGHALSVKDGALQITAGSKLTPADIAAVKAQKTHLIALAAYVAPEGEL